MTSPPSCLSAGGDVAQVWSRAVMSAVSNPLRELAPLVVRIDSFAHSDIGSDVLITLDEYLASIGCGDTDTVADTIFPEWMWASSDGDRKKFFQEFMRSYPRLKSLDRRNRKGTYFGRLIEPLKDMPEGQLEHLIGIYQRHPGLVKMKLQAAVFQPERDHERGARPGFPCLQHISLAPYGKKELHLNAYYASQQLIQKAFGNYLGLVNLGHFLAREMELSLASVNVFVGMAKLSGNEQGAQKFLALMQVAKNCAEQGQEQAP